MQIISEKKELIDISIHTYIKNDAMHTSNQVRYWKIIIDSMYAMCVSMNTEASGGIIYIFETEVQI